MQLLQEGGGLVVLERELVAEAPHADAGRIVVLQNHLFQVLYQVGFQFRILNVAG